jgi:hypothetical protein
MEESISDPALRNIQQSTLTFVHSQSKHKEKVRFWLYLLAALLWFFRTFGEGVEGFCC